MHRLGEGQGMREYYTINNRKGWGLVTTKFKCGTRFWESWRSCGHDNCGCRDSELAVVVSNVTWVLWDITSSEIKLRYKAVLGETIYPTKCSQMLGMVKHH